ncbi:hypothetical protein DYH09_32590 [bacterium CPR1]|nr:hypothetical protein [bacterium CPR1]
MAEQVLHHDCLDLLRDDQNLDARGAFPKLQGHLPTRQGAWHHQVQHHPVRNRRLQLLEPFARAKLGHDLEVRLLRQQGAKGSPHQLVVVYKRNPGHFPLRRGRDFPTPR